MTHVTCRLTAENQDQLRNPTLGNRIRATFLPLCCRSRSSGRRTMNFRRRQSAPRWLAAAMLMTSLLVTSSRAWQPVYRRRYGRPEVAPLRLRTAPHDVTLYPRSSVSVWCRVRVASWALNSFHVGFYVSFCACFSVIKKVKVVHTRLPSAGLWS